MVGHHQHLVGKDDLCSAHLVPVLTLWIYFLVAISAPAFCNMGSVFADVVLLHKNVVMSYILLAIDIPIATYSVVTLPIKP